MEVVFTSHGRHLGVKDCVSPDHPLPKQKAYTSLNTTKQLRESPQGCCNSDLAEYSIKDYIEDSCNLVIEETIEQ